MGALALRLHYKRLARSIKRQGAKSAKIRQETKGKHLPGRQSKKSL